MTGVLLLHGAKHRTQSATAMQGASWHRPTGHAHKPCHLGMQNSRQQQWQQRLKQGLKQQTPATSPAEALASVAEVSAAKWRAGQAFAAGVRAQQRPPRQQLPERLAVQIMYPPVSPRAKAASHLGTGCQLQHSVHALHACFAHATSGDHPCVKPNELLSVHAALQLSQTLAVVRSHWQCRWSRMPHSGKLSKADSFRRLPAVACTLVPLSCPLTVQAQHQQGGPAAAHSTRIQHSSSDSTSRAHSPVICKARPCSRPYLPPHSPAGTGSAAPGDPP